MRDWALGVPLRVVLIVIGAAIVSRLLRRVITRFLRRLVETAAAEQPGEERTRRPAVLLRSGQTARSRQRVDALGSVLRSAMSGFVWLIAALLVLSEVDVELAPLLAGAGVVGIALGFGAQSLVRDFLAGMFILIEDQYGVGDIVDLGEASGVVEDVSLRATRLRAVDGAVWHVANGEIQRVANRSQHWSRALLDVEVAYDTPIAKAREVIKRVADELDEADEHIVEEPEIWGVESLGASSIAIRLVVKTTPSEQWRINRELRERIKEAFDAEGIEIPFPQQTVWHKT